MANNQLAEEVSQFIAENVERRKHNVREDFIKVSNLKVTPSGLIYNDTEFDKKVETNILGKLGLKPKFLNYGEKMSEQDWDLVLRKLKEAYGDGGFYGTAIKTDGGFLYQEYHSKNENKKKDDSGLSVEGVGGLIVNALATTNESFEGKNFHYDMAKNKFGMDFMSTDGGFDAAKSDMWRKGHFFGFNDRSFTRMPIFERMFCSNGMMTRENSFHASIFQTKYNNEKIEKEINKGIMMDAQELEQMIASRVAQLQNINVSVEEFIRMKNFLYRLDENQSDNISKLFNTAPIFAAYKMAPDEMPQQWRRTADSGLNGYNFLNLVTWIGSHNDVAQFNNTHKKDIQIAASNFLMKKEYDLQNMAPKVDISYPVTAEMQ